MGIDQVARDKMQSCFERSKTYLEAVNLPAERKELLARYAEEMMQRER